MPQSNYLERRDQLTTYFDKTAAAAWRALTSTDPVGRIRATVRAGRDEMRNTLLDWLPDDLSDRTVLDAGCGTGALAVEAARRGAHVVAIDVAANLIEVARERLPEDLGPGSVEFRVGDMITDAPAEVDHVVAMDSLIHYDAEDVSTIVSDFARRARHSVLFTSAPWTVPLAAMHFVGRLVPQRKHRAPAIEPVRPDRLIRILDAAIGDAGWQPERTQRVSSGFYISQGFELGKAC